MQQDPDPAIRELARERLRALEAGADARGFIMTAGEWVTRFRGDGSSSASWVSVSGAS